MSETTKVKVVKNVKYGKRRYRAGDIVEIKESERDDFVGDKLIDLSYVPPEPQEYKPLESRTVAELKEYAAENDIDLGEATKKEDILAAILRGLKSAEE